MILTITLIITSLLSLNFILLKFSSNKIIKPKTTNKKPVILHPQVKLNVNSKNLAATGS